MGIFTHIIVSVQIIRKIRTIKIFVVKLTRGLQMNILKILTEFDKCIRYDAF